jgi:DNA-binding response OmpR family regulator
MEAKTILLIEGEKSIADRLYNMLHEAHYIVDLALNGIVGKQLFNIHSYDLVLMDLRLPDTDGYKLSSYIRGRDSAIPLVVLSDSADQGKLEMLQAGVDDYLPITLDFRELLLRIKVLTRRFSHSPKQENKLAAGDIIIDLNTNEVMRGGKAIFLSPKEFLLLKYLVSNKNKIVSRMEIVHNIYAKEVAEKEHRVAAFINSLRGKLEEDIVEKAIFTVTGKGYLLAESS